MTTEENLIEARRRILELNRRVYELEAESKDWKEALANDRQALTGALHDLQASRDNFLLVTEQLAASRDRVAELEANRTFAGWSDAVLREREHVAKVEGERNHLYSALEDIANMPHYDQDDAHRLRHKAAHAIKQPHTSPMTAIPMQP